MCIDMYARMFVCIDLCMHVCRYVCIGMYIYTGHLGTGTLMERHFVGPRPGGHFDGPPCNCNPIAALVFDSPDSCADPEK